MKRIGVIGFVGLFVATLASAQAPSATPAASAAPTASASAAGSALPPGHPPTGELPPGHPPPEPPRDHSGGFDPPEDQVLIDEQLPAGTIDVQILDGERRPKPSMPFTLQILENSVADGEKTSSQSETTNEVGRYRFADMKYGTGVSYRVTTKVEDASFSSEPFGLKDSGGVRVVLHAFEPVRTLAESAFVMEAVVLLEIKEDSIAVNHLLRTLNIGDRALVATGITMPLPEGWHAFTKEDEPTGHGMIEKDGHLEIVGTFPPGQAEMTFRYQVPLTGSSEQVLRLPLPPRVLATRVVIGAGPDMKAEIKGFPTPKAGRWHDGKRVLETGKKADMRGGMEALLANTSPGFLDMKLSGLPTPGPARLIALLLAALGVAGGGFYVFSTRGSASTLRERTGDLEEARDALLEELTVLERAHRDRSVGPRNYERLHNALLDALARIVARLDAAKTARASVAAVAALSKRAKPAAKKARAASAGGGKAKRRAKA